MSGSHQTESSGSKPASTSEERTRQIIQKIGQVTGAQIDYKITDDKGSPSASVDKEGKVQLSKEYLEGATDDDIAFTVAHEVAHHGNQHYKKSEVVIDEMAEKLKVAIKTAPGFIGKTVVAVAWSVTGLLKTRGLSREQELEADGDALDIMERAGYDSRKAEENLSTELGHGSRGIIRELLSTHPTGRERVENLRKKRGTRGV